jgi:thiol:disulfide interchange protein
MKKTWSLGSAFAALALIAACAPAPETDAKAPEEPAQESAAKVEKPFAEEMLSAGKVAWLGDFDEAVAKAKQEGKFVFVKYTASYCVPCKAMEKEALSDEAVVAQLEANAVPVHIDVETAAGDVMDKLYPKKGVPASILIDPATGEEVDRFLGYAPDGVGAKEFKAWLDKHSKA